MARWRHGGTTLSLLRLWSCAACNAAFYDHFAQRLTDVGTLFMVTHGMQRIHSTPRSWSFGDSRFICIVNVIISVSYVRVVDRLWFKGLVVSCVEKSLAHHLWCAPFSVADAEHCAARSHLVRDSAFAEYRLWELTPTRFVFVVDCIPSDAMWVYVYSRDGMTGLSCPISPAQMTSVPPNGRGRKVGHSS